MTPQRQLNRHDPANGMYGDCFRTCIASVLNLPAIEVPNFVDGVDFDNGDDEIFWTRLRTYLAGRGLAYFEVGFTNATIPSVMATIAELNPNIYYFMAVKSPMAQHMIVCCNEDLVCDPGAYPDGLDAFSANDDGHIWVGVLVPDICTRYVEELPYD